MIKELAKFAKQHHKSFKGFTDFEIESFFYHYRDRTIIRTDSKSKITGFGVFENKNGKKHFIILCGTGDFVDNYKFLKNCIKKYKNKIGYDRDLKLCL